MFTNLRKKLGQRLTCAVLGGSMFFGFAAVDGGCTDILDVVLDGVYLTREQPEEEQWEEEHDLHDEW